MTRNTELTIPEINVQELRDLLQTRAAVPSDVEATFDIIDVRQPSEHRICAMEGAILLPLSSLVSGMKELDPGKRHYLLCHHGIRSLRAAAVLRQQGFDAVNISGGIDAWARLIDLAMSRY